FLTDRQVRLPDLEAFVSDPRNLGQWFHGKYVVTRTSGSQGLPAVIVQDRGVMELLFALEARNCPVLPSSARGCLQRPCHRPRLAAVTIGRGFYPSAVGLAYAPKAMRFFLDRLWLAKIHPFEEVVAELNRFRPHVLLAYANVLEMLAREELAGRLHLNAGGPLRPAINMNDPLSRGARKLASSAFGVPITNNYATGEFMILSLGCLKGHGMHLQADWVIMEVVDRDNRPVPPGQPGEKVLLTNLYNRVQPFIRYEVGDVV